MRALSTALLCLAGAISPLAGCSAPQRVPERYAMVIGLKPEAVAEYKELHRSPWEGVLRQLDACQVQNYSIWLVEARPGEYYLFGYLEYLGDDFEADMAAMGEDETTQAWWKETGPCQQPLATAAEGEHWVMMEEVFFHDPRWPGAALMAPPQKISAGRAE